jgi:hypothetical protein
LQNKIVGYTKPIQNIFLEDFFSKAQLSIYNKHLTLYEIKGLSGISEAFTVPNSDAANCVWTRSNVDVSQVCMMVRKDVSTSTARLMCDKAALYGIHDLRTIDYSEVAKADAALTCCSVFVEV